jgi:hypothetical protein
MKINRKNFFKLAGFAAAGLAIKRGQANTIYPYTYNHVQKFNMHGYAASALNKVRVGFIGLGSRGSGVVRQFAAVEGVEIKALCDLIPERLSRAVERLKQYNQKPELYTGSQDAWKRLCERDDIDLVVSTTPWVLHAPNAIYAMEQGKHVAIEIPGVKTLEECWQIVETSERTKKHCTLLANSAYGSFNLLTLNLVREGYLGEVIHGEGAYIHDRVSGPGQWKRDPKNEDWFLYRPWRLKENINRNGNLYAAHGLGTICQAMDLNYGDKMTHMVSMSSNDFIMADKMKELAKEDDFYSAYVGLKFRGNMNTSIIRTYKGRTIMLQHDISSPRPNVRFNMISGTKGIAQHYPLPAKIATGHEGWLSEEEFNAVEEKYRPEISRRVGEMAREQGGHGGTDAMVAWRIVDSLRNGIPLDVDVYDAALWSVVVPLSEWSVANGSMPVEVPDFTCGAWKKNERGMDINLKRGGNTKFI